MPAETRKVVLTRPPAIAIHNDGNVGGNLCRSKFLTHAERSGHGQLPQKLGRGERRPNP